MTLKAEVWRNTTDGDELISEPLIRPCTNDDFHLYFDETSGFYKDWIGPNIISYYYCFDDPYQIQL